MKGRAHKYGAVKTVLDGITFDSKAEASRYAELRFMEKAGAITALKLQPVFPIVIGGKKVCSYRADFSYRAAGAEVIEDVKGMETPVFRLKKKLVEASYPGTVITVVKS